MLIALLLVAWLAGWEGEKAGALGPKTPHLVLVVMENKEYTTVVGNPHAPYINGTIIPGGRLFTSYYASLHPSLPNYLIMTSSRFGGSSLAGRL